MEEKHRFVSAGGEFPDTCLECACFRDSANHIRRVDEFSDTRYKLRDALQEALTPEALAEMNKRFKSALDELESDIEYRVQADMADNLAGWCARMAEDAIKSMLAGDDATMRRYLNSEAGRYTGRDRDHSVIRGKLFETGAIELRKQIVNAHAELLKNERILDLEDQLQSVLQQVRKLEARNEELIRERL